MEPFTIAVADEVLAWERELGVGGGHRPHEVLAQPQREGRVARAHERLGGGRLLLALVEGSAARGVAKTGVAGAVTRRGAHRSYP